MKDNNIIVGIKDNISQTIALTENILKLKLRYKFEVILDFFKPIAYIFMPIIILGQFFTYNADFYPWTSANFMVFIILAYNITLLNQIIYKFPQQFSREKFWQTLPGLMIAPFNKINLLFGIILSHLVLISLPFIAFFVICYFLYPISIITLLFVIVIFFLNVMVLSGIGLIFGVFAISNENIYSFLSFSLTFVIWFSCVTYPYNIFPEIFQSIINLNPLYYMYEIVRLAWIEDNFIITISLHPLNFLVVIISAIIIPILSIFLFNKIYKKFGITGY